MTKDCYETMDEFTKKDTHIRAMDTSYTSVKEMTDASRATIPVKTDTDTGAMSIFKLHDGKINDTGVLQIIINHLGGNQRFDSVYENDPYVLNMTSERR